MKAQGLPYMNRKPKPVPVPTEENGCGRFAPQSFQEFLLTSGKQLDNIIITIILTFIIIIISSPLLTLGKQLDMDGWMTKAPERRPASLDGVGAKHAQLLVKLLEACPEAVVNKVVSTMKEEQLDVMTILVESCPKEMTSNVVSKLIEMNSKQFDLISTAAKTLPKERLEKVVQNLGFVDISFLGDFLEDMEEALVDPGKGGRGVKVAKNNIDVAKGGEKKEEILCEPDGVEFGPKEEPCSESEGDDNEFEAEEENGSEGKDGNDFDLGEDSSSEAEEENADISKENPSKERSTGEKEDYKSKIEKESPSLDGIKVKLEQDEEEMEEELEEKYQIEDEEDLFPYGRLHDQPFDTDESFQNGNVASDLNENDHSPGGSQVPKKRGRKSSPPKECTCPICGKTMKRNSKYDLDRHIATHTGERDFKCDVCGSKFLRVQELKRHEKIHIGDCAFKCSICNAGFKADIALRAHMGAMHGDQTVTLSDSVLWKHECDLCGDKFQSSVAFGKHMKTLHSVTNPFKCETCGMKFTNPDNLKRHVKVTHSNIKPYNCEECGKMFGTKASLTRHQIEHARNNGLMLTSEQEEFLRKQQGENTICDLCGMKLSCAVTLQRHMRTHDPSGFKPHTCELCGKAYSDKRNLTDHIDIVHNHMKNYPCKMCGKVFGRRRNLQDHEKRSHPFYSSFL